MACKYVAVLLLFNLCRIRVVLARWWICCAINHWLSWGDRPSFAFNHALSGFEFESGLRNRDRLHVQYHTKHGSPKKVDTSGGDHTNFINHSDATPGFRDKVFFFFMIATHGAMIVGAFTERDTLRRFSHWSLFALSRSLSLSLSQLNLLSRDKVTSADSCGKRLPPTRIP